MACETSCDPSNPCNNNGCTNAAQAQAQAQAQPPSEPQEPADSSSNTPASSPTSADGMMSGSGDGTVRIGVGNTSSTDINIEVTDNLVVGGRHKVHLGSGNHAAGANTGFISGNVAYADDLLIGADNYAAGGNNEVHVCNNDFKGFSSVRIGVGNYAGRSNKIVIGGPQQPSGPNPGSGPSIPQQPGGFGPPSYGELYGPRGFDPPGNPYYHPPTPPGHITWANGPGPGPNPGRMLSLGRPRPPLQ